MLYPGLYFKIHGNYYCELLDKVRLSGDWERWPDFFADAVIVTATQAVETAQQLIEHSDQDRIKINRPGRSAGSVLEIHRALIEHPDATAGSLVKKNRHLPRSPQ